MAKLAVEEKKKLGVLICNTPSRTKQHFKDDCDINRIVMKYRRDGIITHVSNRVPFYADVTQVPDYRTALGIVNHARSRFAMLPSAVRDRFGNDPAKLLEFLKNPENRSEAERLGLLEVKEKKVPGPGPAPGPDPTNPQDEKEVVSKSKK